MVFCVASDATRIVSYVSAVCSAFRSVTEIGSQHFSRHDYGCSGL